jgi:uncharacterized OB-fold protein
MAKPRTQPVLDELSRAWYDAAREERLLIQRCTRCERYQFYPRSLCVHCGADAVEWHEASGRGRLHTFSVVHYTPNEEFSPDCPYVFAIVELEEGVRMATRLVDVEHEAIVCDMPVRVTFGGWDDLVLPFFTAEGS